MLGYRKLARLEIRPMSVEVRVSRVPRAEIRVYFILTLALETKWTDTSYFKRLKDANPRPNIRHVNPNRNIKL